MARLFLRTRPDQSDLVIDEAASAAVPDQVPVVPLYNGPEMRAATVPGARPTGEADGVGSAEELVAADVEDLRVGFIPSNPRAAAFFDLDNTLMQGASLFYLARGAAARGYITSRDIARFAWQQLRFRMGAENMAHVADAQETALAFVRGRRSEEITHLGEEIFDQYMATRIWPGTRAIAEAHLEAGERVWLVTAAPIEMATVIARRLGLTGALGTISETVDGAYTGRLVGGLLHGPAKAAAVEELAAREGLDLSSCSAYSDSINDVPMLSLVGYPCAINPDTELKRFASEQGWRMRDYRTGRRAARIGIPAAAGLGAATGAVVAGVNLHRRLVA